MTPWVQGFAPIDQRMPSCCQHSLASLLPWQSYPSSLLYSSFCIVLAMLAGFHHAWISAAVLHGQRHACTPHHPGMHWANALGMCGQGGDVPGSSPSHSDMAQAALQSTLMMMVVWTLTLASGIIPCAMCFVIITWVHSRRHAAAAAAAASAAARPLASGGSGAASAAAAAAANDCTAFVRFRDPAVHARFRGKRIDAESLYEMYFDGQLDFAVAEGPADNHGSSTTTAPAASTAGLDTSHDCPRRADCCLLNDVLSRRHEFVDYTFGLTTHLPFLLSQWILDVLSHSKQQDVSQVRDHYDRSTFYAAALGGFRSSQPFHSSSGASSKPFTSDEAEDDFFGMFLGKTMVYTSGISSAICSGAPPQPCHASGGTAAASSPPSSTSSYFSPPSSSGHEACIQRAASETLDSMQENKLRLICKKLRLSKNQTHLDIGCGWGTLVNHSASKKGTVATGVTLSRNQVAYASATSKILKIKDHRTTFWCRDYRDIPTNVGVKYDRISCIEMAEHVGVKNFQAFLQQVYDLLEDDGLFLLQIAGLRRAFQVMLCLCMIPCLLLQPPARAHHET
jgi:cyclopropane fatty-acyl-phospholipid synthase-like methyltransferase